VTSDQPVPLIGLERDPELLSVYFKVFGCSGRSDKRG
jgi:hypothetical protein